MNLSALEASVLFGVPGVVALVLVAAGFYRIFEKAGVAGWKALVPVYNAFVLTGIVGRAFWLAILLFVPVVGLVVWIVLVVDLARSFGRGVGTALGLYFLPFVFAPIIGWGSAEYQGPAALGPGGPTAYA